MKLKHLVAIYDSYSKNQSWSQYIVGDFTPTVVRLQNVIKLLKNKGLKEEDSLPEEVVEALRKIVKKDKQKLMEDPSFVVANSSRRVITTMSSHLSLDKLHKIFEETQNHLDEIRKRSEYDASHNQELVGEFNEKVWEAKNPKGINLAFISNFHFIDLTRKEGGYILTREMVNTSFIRLEYLEQARHALIDIQDKCDRLMKKGTSKEVISAFINPKELKQTWGNLIAEYKKCADDILKLIGDTIHVNVDTLHKEPILRLGFTFDSKFINAITTINNSLKAISEKDLPDKYKRDFQEIKAILQSANDQLVEYKGLEARRIQEKSSVSEVEAEAKLKSHLKKRW